MPTNEPNAASDAHNDSEPEDPTLNPMEAVRPSLAGNWMLQQLAIDCDDEFDPMDISAHQRRY